MPIKRASIYKLPSRFIVCPVSTTTAGINITCEPYIVLWAPIASLELSKAINEALDKSQNGIAHPQSWKGLAAPRLAAAGVKSEATFQKQASLVSLISDGKTVTFTPHRNGGATGNDKGFSPINECEIQVDQWTSEIAGEIAFRAFEGCA